MEVDEEAGAALTLAVACVPIRVPHTTRWMHASQFKLLKVQLKVDPRPAAVVRPVPAAQSRHLVHHGPGAAYQYSHTWLLCVAGREGGTPVPE